MLLCSFIKNGFIEKNWEKLMTIEYVTIGEITVDDTVLETNEIKRAQTGGGSIYSACGIHLWDHSVGINSVVGHDYDEENLKILERNDISTQGIKKIKGWSLRLWLLHEENNKKQQFPKLQSSTFFELDELRDPPPIQYYEAKGFHLSPATPQGQMRSRDLIRKNRPEALVSMDILSEPFISLEDYQNGSALQGIDIFSPSIIEIEKLFPGLSVDDSLKRIADFGVRWIAIKMDIRGSIVYDSKENRKYYIPVFPVKAIDTTGAGDAFSGGFLEGIAHTGNVLEAGLRATISASFAIENWGAFHMLDVEKYQVQLRYKWLKENAIT